MNYEVSQLDEELGKMNKKLIDRKKPLGLGPVTPPQPNLPHWVLVDKTKGTRNRYVNHFELDLADSVSYLNNNIVVPEWGTEL